MVRSFCGRFTSVPLLLKGRLSPPFSVVQYGKDILGPEDIGRYWKISWKIIFFFDQRVYGSSMSFMVASDSTCWFNSMIRHTYIYIYKCVYIYICIIYMHIEFNITGSISLLLKLLISDPWQYRSNLSHCDHCESPRFLLGIHQVIRGNHIVNANVELFIVSSRSHLIRSSSQWLIAKEGRT